MLGRDKAASTHWVFNPLTVQQLEAAYRGDWVARKIVDIPAFDSTRAWRSWDADQVDIKKMRDAEKALQLQRKTQMALTRSRLYGGSAMIMGIDQGRFHEPLEPEKVKKGDLKFVHVVERWMLSTGPLVRDITSPWYGEPQWYMRSNPASAPPPVQMENIGEPTLGYRAGDQIYIHPSRVVRFIGLEYPDVDAAPDAWGDSVLQPVADAVKDAGLVCASIAAMIAEAKLDVIKVPGLMDKLATAETAAELSNRFAQANVAKSVINALLLDTEEEWERRELQMSGLDKVMQVYLLLACGAADIPSTRFFGREPAGQNSTGESDMRNYYDRLASDQTMRVTPAMSRFDEVLIRSMLGTNDPNSVSYAWESLWQMSDAEKADVEFKKAQAHNFDVAAGLINPNALRIGRENSLIESGFLYPGFDEAIKQAGEWDAIKDVDEHDLQKMQSQQELMAKSREDPSGPSDPGGGKPGAVGGGEG